MNQLLERLAILPIEDAATQALLSAALGQFYAFTLVLIRLSGLMVIGPVFGQSLVPGNVRVFIVFTLALLISPTIANHAQTVFHRLDANRDGALTRDEIPQPLTARFEKTLEELGRREEVGLPAGELKWSLPQPKSILDYAWIGVGEFGLGMVLGLGVLTILSGLQLAGDLIDQQTGVSLGEIANPGLDITGSITGQFLFSFALTVLLVMQPTGYHLVIVSALVDTFHVIPLGEAMVSVPAIDLLRDLVHQSLVLGVQVAAPMLASMSLIALTLGFLGHTVPQLNIMVVGFPVRAVISLVVMAASFSGVAAVVVESVPAVIDQLRAVLSG